MPRTYTILRDVSQTRTSEPFRGGRVGSGAAGVPEAVPEPRIETADLTTREVRDLARDPEVAAIAPVMPTKLIRPVDMDAQPAAATAWGISAVKADESPFTGEGVIACVLDTGIDASHPAFAGVSLIQQDFSGSGNGDRQGHGTHCAGTVFGRDVDGTRIGVARGVETALIGKVLGDDGGGDSDMIFRGIQWAVDNNANVISMSLGFDFPGFVRFLVEQQQIPVEPATSMALEAYRGNLRMFDALMAIVRARAAFGGGTLLVAAAGNESNRGRRPDYEIAASLPAAAEGIVSVGALEQTTGGLGVAFFSNTFPQISAPGVGVLSAKAGGGLRSLSGTSMATPHVAGVAALWWEAVRRSPIPATAVNVLSKLIATARSTGFAAGGDIADRGVGIVTAPLSSTA